MTLYLFDEYFSPKGVKKIRSFDKVVKGPDLLTASS